MVNFHRNILDQGSAGCHIHGLHAQAESTHDQSGFLKKQWFKIRISATPDQMKKEGGLHQVTVGIGDLREQMLLFPVKDRLNIWSSKEKDGIGILYNLPEGRCAGIFLVNVLDIKFTRNLHQGIMGYFMLL